MLAGLCLSLLMGIPNRYRLIERGGGEGGGGEGGRKGRWGRKGREGREGGGGEGWGGGIRGERWVHCIV